MSAATLPANQHVNELTDEQLSKVAGGGTLDNLRDLAAAKIHALQVALSNATMAQEAAGGSAKKDDSRQDQYVKA